MTKRNKIEIELFRVSSDSSHLDMIFNIPYDFYMSDFLLEVRSGNGEPVKYQLNEALEFSSENDQRNWIVRIPLRKLNINYPAIYIASLKALYRGDDYSCEISDTAICSDVNGVYRCLLDEVVDTCDTCDANNPISDEAIRNYLILYGHHAAMALRDLDRAEEYFRILSKCFKPCGGASDCGCKKVKPSNCGCNA